MSTNYSIRPGSHTPPGVHVDEEGINFCIFSRHATRVELVLYETGASTEPFQLIALDPEVHRTFFFWHVFVENLEPGVHYTWRVDGPGDTEHTGFRFNPNKELLDPWARAVNDQHWSREQACHPHENRQTAMRAVVASDHFDWQGDEPLNHSLEHSIIYEMHVGGFTRHSSSGATHPGTFSAIIEKIDYLKDLGITDVELMPVMAFDEQDVPLGTKQRGLRNYWGYSTHSFYSPHPRYCVSTDPTQHPNEFREMVRALHQAKLGVILDVVFNHTAEGGEGGPTINFKGLDNEIFYHLDPADRRKYLDFTGCGNTVNCNHPLVTRYITASLAYWVRQMHVDGFRFDLASVFARGEEGRPMYNAPLPWAIAFSRTLARTRIIAEAWDAGGLYQVGAFPGFRWSEWNGRYRDTIRRFARGDKGLVKDVATALAGSSDLYHHQGRLPTNSINFVTCHDGFTLNDLVSYSHKHNEDNGENNRDGQNDNFSDNYGIEGPSSNATIRALRRQQARNMMTLLMLSQGVPMLSMGDEVLRSQHGNNNGYCQDNEISWLNWHLLDENRDMLRFVKHIIALRKRHASLQRHRFLTGKVNPNRGIRDIEWHGPRLNEPLWDDPDGQILVFTLAGTTPAEDDLHVVCNMADAAWTAPLPRIAHRKWFRAVDTSRASPEDILPPREQPLINATGYQVRPHSVVVLEAR